MRRHVALAFILSLASVTACSSPSSDPGAPPPVVAPTDTSPSPGPPPPAPSDIPARYAEIAKAVEAERQALGAPGVAIAVLEHGEVTFAYGFGVKTAGKKEPVKPTTLFRLGSVTKGLSATAVLRLVADGKVDLDASVPSIAPEFHFDKDATWAPAIKVRNLLNHTAGQVDYLQGDSGPLRQSDDELQRWFSVDWPKIGFVMFPAGAMYDYANPNYNVAGLVIEKASGKHYRDYMKEAVFGPLGMTRTIFTPEEMRADGDFADGSAKNTDGSTMVVGGDSFDSPAERACGYAVSSVFDLAKFVKFVVKGNDAVLPSDLRIAMQSKQVDTKQFLDMDAYGFGVQVFDYYFDPTDKSFRKLHIVGHAGELGGVSTDWQYVPSLDVGFITLSNASGVSYPKSFATVLKTLTTLPAPEPLPTLTTDAATLAAVAGTYHDDNPTASGLGDVIVKNVGTTLSLEVPSLASTSYDGSLQPASPKNFVTTLEGYPDLVTFIFDDAGKPAYLRTRGFVARRADAGGSSPTPAPPNPFPPRPLGRRHAAPDARVRTLLDIARAARP